MSATVGYATLQIIPSAKGFQAALGSAVAPQLARSGREGGAKMGAGILAGAKGFVGPLAGLFALDKAKDFFVDAVSGASDLNEAGTAVTQVFGKATGKINAFAAQGAKSLGMSRLQALNAAQTFGVYGKAAGLSSDQNAKFSSSLVGLSTDLASFYNTSPDEAMQAIAAGLRGESEPLRRYGVLLNDATLKSQALKMGLITTTKSALTPQQKVLAAQAVIMKQTSVAQGDFQRTSGGLANQQRILSAQFTDLKSNIGKALLPVVLGAVKGFNGLFTAIGPIVSKVGAFFSSLSSGSGSVSGIVGQISSLASSLGAALGPSIQSALGFVRTLMPGLSALGATIGQLASRFVGFLQANLLPLFNQLRTIAAPAFAALGSTIQTVVTEAVPILNGLANVAAHLWHWFGPIILSTITSTFSAIVRIVTGALNVVKGIFQVVSGILTGNWSKVWTGIKNILSGALNVIIGLIQFAIISKIGGLVRGGLGIVSGLFRAFGGRAVGLIGSMVSRIVGFFASLAGRAVGLAGSLVSRVAGLFGSLASRAVAAAGRLVSSVIGLFRRMVSSLVSEVGRLVGRIVGFFGNMLSRAAGETSKGIGRIVQFFAGLPGKILGAVSSLPGRFSSFAGHVIGGFVSGLTSQAGRITNAIKSTITDHLPGFVKKALGIHSPSRVMAQLGYYTAEGMAVGLRQGAGEVQRATKALAAIPAGADVGVDVTAGAGHIGPLVGSLTVVPGAGESTHDALEETLYQLRRLKRGGR